MGIMVYRDKQSASHAAATVIAAQMIEKPNCVLGLSASSELTLAYRQLSVMTSAGILDWGEVSVFHPSELISRRPGRLGLFMEYMRGSLYDSVGLSASSVYAPQHDAPDWEQACTAFEDSLSINGGMDLLVLTLGSNGHIALNGPSREFSSYTHVELLSESMAEECAAVFQTAPTPNLQAVTMGLSTLLSARRIILCAFGKGLAPTISRVLSSTITPILPASLLQLHPSITYMMDEEAASLL